MATLKSSGMFVLPEAIAHSGSQTSFPQTDYESEFRARNVEELPQNVHHHVNVPSLPGGPSQVIPHDQCGSASRPGQYPADCHRQSPTYGYGSFDEPLNWIPPSIYPSP